jgi:hypothetical protein
MNLNSSRNLSDFHVIKQFREWVYNVNARSMTYLAKNVQKGDIVVTHHIPTIEGVHPRWLPSQETLGRFFLCQMPPEVLCLPKLWVYGHTHDSMDFQKDGCRFLCNPYGYHRQDQNAGYRPKLVVEV